jgi:putative transposase
MKAYSVDLRTKIVAAHLEQKLSIRKTAEIFACSKSLVQKLVKQQKSRGIYSLKPGVNPDSVI